MYIQQSVDPCCGRYIWPNFYSISFLPVLDTVTAYLIWGRFYTMTGSQVKKSHQHPVCRSAQLCTAHHDQTVKLDSADQIWITRFCYCTDSSNVFRNMFNCSCNTQIHRTFSTSYNDYLLHASAYWRSGLSNLD